MNKEKEIQKIKKELENLKESPFYKYRKEKGYQPVVGAGSLDANIMFIGEAPGKKEAETGKPFVGSAGRLLDKLLDEINLKREDVYITNIVHDRPPDNRDPKPEEIELYSPFLERIIEIVNPKIIATLGRFSMEYVLVKYGLENKLDTITKLHGKIFKTDSIQIMPLFHPAATIYNRSLRKDMEEDFKKLKKKV